MPNIAPRSGQDWTDEERREISHLQDACQTLGDCQLECGHTEDGDPWCIVYEKRNQSIVLHIARIDRRYFLVFPTEARPLRTATIAEAVNTVLNRIGLSSIVAANSTHDR